MVGIMHDHPKNPPRPMNPSRRPAEEGSDSDADDTSRATGSTPKWRSHEVSAAQGATKWNPG